MHVVIVRFMQAIQDPGPKLILKSLHAMASSGWHRQDSGKTDLQQSPAGLDN